MISPDHVSHDEFSLHCSDRHQLVQNLQSSREAPMVLKLPPLYTTMAAA
jgi:hypothetical protein